MTVPECARTSRHGWLWQMTRLQKLRRKWTLR